MASNYYEKLIEEMNRRNPGGLPEDAASLLPPSITDEFDARELQPDVPVTPTDPTIPIDPTAPTPDISSENIPELTPQTLPIGPSSFDVDVSNTTPRMEGRPESLPSAHSLPESAALPERKWELEKDILPLPESEPVKTSTPPDVPATPDREVADTKLLSTGQDEKERARILADLEKKRKLQAIPQFAAGVGDAISASASAFGGNAPGGSMERMIKRQDEQMGQAKLDIETKFRDDSKSDISKQYQNLLAQMMQKDPSDTAILGLTANQIAEKIPMIEKMMQRRSTEDLKKLALKATAAKKDTEFTPAQKKFDEEMAKSIAEFTDSGGIKAADAAIDQLDDVITRFKRLDPGKLSQIGSGAPSMVRGLIQPEYKAIEQEVRQNVTELLRATLGAQFTEREGERIFSQTFDPTLPPEINLRRMEVLRTKLRTMADERARAVEYFTKNKTFDGYKPQSNSNWTIADDKDLKNVQTEFEARQTKAGHKYTVGA